MKRKVAFLHASPAAVPPLAEFCANEAPDLEVTNLLDDSLLRSFRSGDLDSAEARLKDMLAVARDIHGAELAMLTCSAVPKDRMESLRRSAGITLLKIDAPMAEAAVRAARRIGVAVTFPRTLDTAIQLLAEAAEDARVRIELFPLVAPEAYEALLRGEHERHDELLLDLIDRLASQPVEAIVLSQISMVRILPKLVGRLKVPVFSSLRTSLEAIRRILESRQQRDPAGWHSDTVGAARTQRQVGLGD